MVEHTGLNIFEKYFLIVLYMEGQVEKVYPLLANVKELDSNTVKTVVSTLRTFVTADDALAVLRAAVTKWQQETKGVVPFELDATFEAVVSLAFASEAETKKKVVAVGVGCFSYFYSLFCRSVRTVEQTLVTDLSGAIVDSSLPQGVKDIALDVVGDVAKAVDDVVKAVDNVVKAVDDKVAAVDNKVAAVVDDKVAAAVVDNKVDTVDNKVVAVDSKAASVDNVAIDSSEAPSVKVSEVASHYSLLAPVPAPAPAPAAIPARKFSARKAGKSVV